MTITARGWSCVTWSSTSTSSWALSCMFWCIARVAICSHSRLALLVVWILVPIFSGLLSCLIYGLVLKFVISSNDPVCTLFLICLILFWRVDRCCLSQSADIIFRIYIYYYRDVDVQSSVSQWNFNQGESGDHYCCLYVLFQDFRFDWFVACGTLLGSYFFGPAVIRRLIQFKRTRQIKVTKEKKIVIEEVPQFRLSLLFWLF
jgi:phosphate/sulfate permease